MIRSTGDDAIERIVEMSLQAHSLAEAGDARAAQAMLALGTLLYRNTWSQAKTDALALNDELESFIEAGDYEGQAQALTPYTEGGDGFGDLCKSPGGFWFISPSEPWYCAETGGRPVRVDYSLVDENAENGSQELYTGDPKTADAGGVGIHKITQHKTANDKLAGKKFKKAWAKALKKHGPTIASLAAYGPDATLEQQVIELVLAAREADEAGDAKAAKAFMALALARYRRAVPTPDETTDPVNTEALNYSIADLIEAEYADTAGLELMPPDGTFNWCYSADETKCMWYAGEHTPWECDDPGNMILKRVPPEEAVAAGCEWE